MAGVTVDVRVPGIDSSVNDDFAPPSPPAGDSPPLAKEWLRARFRTDEQRTAYTTRILSLARDMVGRAHMIEQMEERLPALGTAPLIEQLAAVLQDHERRLREDVQGLRVSLEPLTGPLPDSGTSPVSLAPAQELRQALTSLLAMSRAGDSLAEAVDRVRGFFEQ
jgi:hypothetical protein